MELLSDLSFKNCRVRFQVLKTAKFGSGWVKEFREREILVRVAAEEAPPPMHSCFLELCGAQRDALVFARGEPFGVESEKVAYIRFVPTGKISFRAPMSEARFMVSGVSGAVASDFDQFEVTVLDVSQKGLAILGSRQFESGEILLLNVVSSVGVTALEAEVRYSRPAEADAGAYRTGLQIRYLNRLDQARWLSFHTHCRAA